MDDTIDLHLELRRGSNHPKKDGTYFVWYTAGDGPEDMNFTVKNGWNTKLSIWGRIPDSNIYAWCEIPENITGNFLFDEDEENEGL